MLDVPTIRASTNRTTAEMREYQRCCPTLVPAKRIARAWAIQKTRNAMMVASTDGVKPYSSMFTQVWS